jgi:hypothetical protein
LWLRIVLRGARRRSPAIAALRVTFPRPSILDHLPSFWRNDPSSAKVMEEFFGMILDAADLAALAKEYDAKITPMLNLK